MNARACRPILPLMGSTHGGVVDSHSNRVLWGGYDVSTAQMLPENSGRIRFRENRVCSDCGGLPRRVVQTMCGRLLCKDCNQYRTLTLPPGRLCHECLADNKPDTPENIRSCSLFQVDNCMERIIGKFYLKCPFAGCQWQGTLAELYGLHEDKHLTVGSLKNLSRLAIQRQLSRKKILLSEYAALSLPLAQELIQYLAFAPAYIPSNQSAKAYVERHFGTTDTSGLLAYLFLNRKGRVITLGHTFIKDPYDKRKTETTKCSVIKQAVNLKASLVQFYYRQGSGYSQGMYRGSVIASLREEPFFVHGFALKHIDCVQLWKATVPTHSGDLG
ncbi:hypothetical protein [Endozoicomonas sp. ONNA2]|uniref:hypothetical protein n=1 Tax=Endozoicomonas sp. ONNA2 TaxID=2828741 RepID=UPI00214975D0|nr:hypothetical protein [Endozoicomonas sp. ONNA2]